MSDSKFFYNMGRIVMTPTIAAAIGENSRFATDVSTALGRYFRKDWGDISDASKQINDNAFNHPDDLYILAAYYTCKGKIFIMTNRKSENAGDNCTTILFPDER